MGQPPNEKTGIPDEQVRRFASIFRGRTDCYGDSEGLAVKAATSTSVYRAHLEGRRAIGVYPLQPDETIWFAAIDFDRKTDKETGLERAPEQIDAIAVADARAVNDVLCSWGLNVGTALERSKSKGTHLWLFFTAPVPAAPVIRLLHAAYAKAIGRRKSDPFIEIFPKQSKLSEKNPYGNYINIPYNHAGDQTETHRVLLDWETLEPLTFEAALDFIAGGWRFPGDALEEVLAQVPDLPPERKPGEPAARQTETSMKRQRLYPCTVPMLSHGMHEHTGRNQFGFLLAKRLREGGFDNEEGYTQLSAWNFHNTPVLDDVELRRIWDSSAKYTGMSCDDPLVEPFCKTFCPIHPKNPGGDYTRLRKFTTDPPSYSVRIGDLDVLIQTMEMLADHRRVTLEAAKQFDFLPAHVKPARWAEILATLLESIEVIDTPREATPGGMTWAYVLSWLTTRYDDDGGAAEEDPEMAPEPIGGAVERDGWTWFKAKDLAHELEARKAPRLKLADLWMVIQSHGGIATVKRFGKTTHRVWGLPTDAIGES